MSSTMEDWRRSKLEELKKETELLKMETTTTSNNGNMNGGGDDGSDGHHEVGRTEELKIKKKKPSTSRIRCSAVNCKHYVAAHPELAFHRFPRDPERSSKWLQALGNPNLADMSVERLSSSYRVCSAHFHPSQFKRKVDVHAGLNWDAVPRIGLDGKPGRKQPILHQELPNKSKHNYELRRSSAVDSYTTDHDQRRIISETKLTVPGKVIVITRHPRPLISTLPLPKTPQSPLPRPTMSQMWALPPRRLPTMLQTHTQRLPTMLQTQTQRLPTMLQTQTQRLPTMLQTQTQRLPTMLQTQTQRLPTMLQTQTQRLPTMLQTQTQRLPTMLQTQTQRLPTMLQTQTKPLISPLPLPKTSQSPLLTQPPPTMLQTPRPLLLRKPQSSSSSQSPLPMSNTSSQPKTSSEPPEPECAAAAVREIALKRKVRNLQARVSKLKTKVRALKGLKNSTTVAITKTSVLQLMKKLLSATAFKFFRAQLNVAQRKAHGFRWSDRDKAFFLDLLRASPRCYRLMTAVFSMPSVRTLQRLVKPADFNPGGVDQNIVTTSEEVEENSVTTSEVEENFATTSEVEENFATTSEVEENFATTSEVEENSVTTSEVEENSATTSEVEKNFVITSEVEKNFATTSEVEENFVTTSEVEENFVITSEVEENFATTSEVEETPQPVAEVCAAVTELQRAQHFS